MLPAGSPLHGALTRRSVETRDIIKIGRTHRRTRRRMTLGQEFGGYAKQVESGWRACAMPAAAERSCALGGTASVTG